MTILWLEVTNILLLYIRTKEHLLLVEVQVFRSFISQHLSCLKAWDNISLPGNNDEARMWVDIDMDGKLDVSFLYYIS